MSNYRVIDLKPTVHPEQFVRVKLPYLLSKDESAWDYCRLEDRWRLIIKID